MVPEICVLDVTLTKDLKCSAHASRTQKSVVRMLGVLNRFGSTLNTECRRRILQAFIMPKLTYALPVWCWVDTTTAKALDITIQRAAHIVLHKQNAMLDSSTYEATGLHPFHLMSLFKSLICVHNYLSKPNYEVVLSALLSDSHSQHTTRSVICRKFYVPSHSTCADEYCFYYPAAVQWNNLPFNLSLLESMFVFKSNVTKYILASLNV